MALLKTIPEFRRYVPTLNKNMAWDTMQPFVEQAELKYLRSLLGDAQHDALHTAYQANTLSGAQVSLLKYVQQPLALYAFYECLPFLGAMVSDMGVTEQSSSEGTSAPARQFVLNDMRRATIENADLFADRLLDFLEANHTSYPVWSGSSAFTISRSLFINKTSDLAAHINISDSKRAYLAIRPFITLAENEFILPALGKALFDDLKAKVTAQLTTPLTTQYATILAMVRRPLAWLAFLRALPALTLSFKNDGISVSSTAEVSKSFSDTNRYRYEATRLDAQTTGTAYLRELAQYLEENAADITLYESQYPTQPGYDLPDNTGKKSFMV